MKAALLYFRVTQLALKSWRERYCLRLTVHCFFLSLATIVVVALCLLLLLLSFLIWLKWLDTGTSLLVGMVAGIVSLVGGWFMLPALMMFAGSFFENRLILGFELSQRLPGRSKFQQPLPRLETTGLSNSWTVCVHGLKITLKVLVLNLMILPLYWIWLGGLGLLLSIWINSYFLGREFFSAVASHYGSLDEATELIRVNRGLIFLGGFTFTLMGLVPLVNLFVPLFAIVWSIHSYQAVVNK